MNRFLKVARIVNAKNLRKFKGRRSYPICQSKWHFRFNSLTHPWKRQVWSNIFFGSKTIYKGTNRNSNCKRLTYYTMMTLFDQNRKWHNPSPRFTDGTPSCSTDHVPGSFDRHVQLLTTGNFPVNWNLDKTLVRVMRFNICDRK